MNPTTQSVTSITTVEHFIIPKNPLPPHHPSPWVMVYLFDSIPHLYAWCIPAKWHIHGTLYHQTFASASHLASLASAPANFPPILPSHPLRMISQNANVPIFLLGLKWAKVSFWLNSKTLTKGYRPALSSPAGLSLLGPCPLFPLLQGVLCPPPWGPQEPCYSLSLPCPSLLGGMSLYLNGHFSCEALFDFFRHQNSLVHILCPLSLFFKSLVI